MEKIQLSSGNDIRNHWIHNKTHICQIGIVRHHTLDHMGLCQAKIKIWLHGSRGFERLPVSNSASFLSV